MCSPTRAALLTGLNPHAAGIGHVAHSDPGFPGYAMELATDAATSAELLRDAGYATLMVGKWHLAKDSDCSDAGPRHSWPCQRGFDRFYGFLDGFTNLHHPHRLVCRTTPPSTSTEYPEGYYLTDDLTDRAIEMVQSVKASRPVEAVLPLLRARRGARAAAREGGRHRSATRGRYAAGWDALRVERFARQLALGVVPPRDGAAAAQQRARQRRACAWDSLPAEQQELFARYMEVYAGMVDSIDQQFGRLMAALDALGELDNTIVLFTSDNGASREGEAEGTTAYYQHLLGTTDLDADLSRLDEIGGPTDDAALPARVGDGVGHAVPAVQDQHPPGRSLACRWCWPGPGVGEGMRRQFAHVTDVLPTLLDLLDVERPPRRGRAWSCSRWRVRRSRR